MAIRALSKQEFDGFGSPSWTLARLTEHAIEWFADDAAPIVGAIASHGSGLDWSFVILKRDRYGKVRALDLDLGIRDPEAARQRLFERMTTALEASESPLSHSSTLLSCTRTEGEVFPTGGRPQHEQQTDARALGIAPER
jgi:hypothetical protein